jgi:hypothetical protein
LTVEEKLWLKIIDKDFSEALRALKHHQLFISLAVILHDHFVVFDRHFNFLSSWGRLCIQSVPNQVAAIWN